MRSSPRTGSTTSSALGLAAVLVVGNDPCGPALAEAVRRRLAKGPLTLTVVVELRPSWPRAAALCDPCSGWVMVNGEELACLEAAAAVEAQEVEARVGWFLWEMGVRCQTVIARDAAALVATSVAAGQVDEVLIGAARAGERRRLRRRLRRCIAPVGAGIPLTALR